MFGRFNAQSGSLCELLRTDNLRMYFAEKAHKFKTFSAKTRTVRIFYQNSTVSGSFVKEQKTAFAFLT